MAGRRRQSTDGSWAAQALGAAQAPGTAHGPDAAHVPDAASPRSRAWWVSRRGTVRDAGMATAEYAIATIAAVGFAGLLVIVLRSGEVQALLLGIIRRALSV